MKRKVLFILLCFCFTLSVVAYAHPPQDIIITFDKKTNTLNAVIKHSVSNPATHYIKKVDIGLNGKEIKELKFTKQDNSATQSVSYAIVNVRPGDKLSVEGYCNLSGKLEKEITVK
ncbi:MAG: hypothetical protein NTZ63_03580 [Candidatus Omnitrophica bacterium]|nr:hypothetical protein [Candidatus Omnitrophota bacterium]